MRKIVIIVIGLLIVGIALFMSRAVTSTMSIQLSGVAGTQFTGFYVRGGQHIAVSGTLPWSLDKTDITEFEFRKVHPEDLLSFTVHYDKPGTMVHSDTSGDIVPGYIGVRCRVEQGFKTETFLR